MVVAIRPTLLPALLLALGHLALELLHDVRLAQGGHVAELAALGDVPQQPPHDLPRARLGQIARPDDALGPGQLADPLGHVLADLALDLVGALEVALEGHERGYGLAAVLVRLADAGRLGHLGMRDDRRLDLGGGETVARDVDDVVDAPDDPEVAVGVLARGIADEVDLTPELLEVGLDEALVLPVESAQHPGPRPAKHQQALLVGVALVAVVVED